MKKKTTPKRTSPHRALLDENEAFLRSIKKPFPQRKRLAKIAEAPTLHDKLTLAHHGMTEKEFYAPEMILARDFFKTRRIDTTELMQRIKDEVAMTGEVTARTESEYGTLKSAEKFLYHFAWEAVRRWKPEMFLRLAWAMQRIARHKFPDNHDGWRRSYLIGCQGNVADAVKCIHWQCDPDQEKRKLTRLKKTLFPQDT